MHRSYVPREWIDSFINNEHLELPPDVGERFVKVLRVKHDEKVAVFDGCGREIIGYLSEASRLRNASLRRGEPLIPAIILLQAAIVELKLSETIQRACEYGVDEIVIFPAERSDAFCFAKLEKRIERLNRIAIDAARQSERLYVPTIRFFPDLSEALIWIGKKMGRGYFGDITSGHKLSHSLAQGTIDDKFICIAVGPEGGFSQNESEQFSRAGLDGVTWSPFVLRTELACLSAIAIINAYYGRA